MMMLNKQNYSKFELLNTMIEISKVRSTRKGEEEKQIEGTIC